MSILKRLFGLGEGAASSAPAEPAVEYKGYTIRPTPYQDGAQWQTCGTVSRIVDGQEKTHRFIRADRFPTREGAADHALAKGRQLVDQQGDRVFD